MGISKAERDRREQQRAESEILKGVNAKNKDDITQALQLGYSYVIPQVAAVSIGYVNSIQGAIGTWVSSNNLRVSPLSPSPNQYIWTQGSAGNQYTNVLYNYQSQLSPSPSESRPKRKLPVRRAGMPVVGFRSWNVNFKGRTNRPILYATGAGLAWRGLEIRAMCLGQNRLGQHMLPSGVSARHRSPHQECTCGVYLYKRPQLAARAGDISGAVVTWGKHVEHGEQGYRAAYARVIAFAEPSRTAMTHKAWLERWVVAEAVAVGFKLPLIPWEKLETYAREFGELLVD